MILLTIPIIAVVAILVGWWKSNAFNDWWVRRELLYRRKLADKEKADFDRCLYTLWYHGFLADEERSHAERRIDCWHKIRRPDL